MHLQYVWVGTTLFVQIQYKVIYPVSEWRCNWMKFILCGEKTLSPLWLNEKCSSFNVCTKQSQSNETKNCLCPCNDLLFLLFFFCFRLAFICVYFVAFHIWNEIIANCLLFYLNLVVMNREKLVFALHKRKKKTVFIWSGEGVW